MQKRLKNNLVIYCEAVDRQSNE